MCQNVIMGAADLFTHDLGVFCMPKLSRCEDTFAQTGTLVAEMYAALCWKFSMGLQSFSVTSMSVRTTRFLSQVLLGLTLVTVLKEGLHRRR